MRSYAIFQFIIAILVGILFVISFIFGNYLLFATFFVFVVVIFQLFFAINNYNRELFVTTVSIFLFLSTIICSFLTSTNGLTSFVTYVPFIAGFLLAGAATWDLNIGGLIYEGTILMNKKKFPEALDNFDRTLELSPKNYIAGLNRANILNYMERYDEALDEADEILERYSEDIPALIISSKSLSKLGENEEALEIVEEILENPPKNQGAMSVILVTKGEILFEKGNYLEAISCYDEALVKIPAKKALFRQGMRVMYMCYLDYQIAEIWFEKGKAHQKLQQYDKALECLNKALELDPDSEDANNAKEEVSKLLV